LKADNRWPPQPSISRNKVPIKTTIPHYQENRSKALAINPAGFNHQFIGFRHLGYPAYYKQKNKKQKKTNVNRKQKNSVSVAQDIQERSQPSEIFLQQSNDSNDGTAQLWLQRHLLKVLGFHHSTIFILVPF